MQEADLAGQASPRCGVEELDTALLQMGQRVRHVRRLEAHVVQPLAALGEEAAHRRRRAQRLQQLDLAVAGGEQRGLHTLLGDLRLPQQGQSEHVAIERVRIGETLHHDSHVMNPSNHLLALLIGHRT